MKLRYFAYSMVLGYAILKIWPFDNPVTFLDSVVGLFGLACLLGAPYLLLALIANRLANHTIKGLRDDSRD